jgi:hypothetical protein
LRLSLVIITDKKASSRHTNNSSRPIFQLHWTMELHCYQSL